MSIRIYIDTNVYLNAILDRDNGISKMVLSFLAGADTRVFLNDISIINIHYIIRRTLERHSVLDELRTLREENDLVSVDEWVIDRALESDFRDFEDAVQYFCAQKAQAELIITDNVKDYRLSGILVMTVKDFFEKYVTHSL